MSKAWLLGMILMSALPASAQQVPVASSSPNAAKQANQGLSSSKSPAASADTRYRIGPGDVLDVRVARAPELSRDAVRVDQDGMIRMPMLDVDIQAACLTEPEVAANIARLYLKYKKEPHVDVFVKEYQSEPVAVLGAVRLPQQFKLQRQVRLLEMLSLAGGPTETAGRTVQVVHAGGRSLCEKENEEPANVNTGLVTYKLNDTLAGLPEANPYVRPGDIVQVLVAEQIYVIGNVIRPSIISIKEPITISRAIAVAGGTRPATNKDKVRIIRVTPGSGTKQEIYVDLSAIEKRKAEDTLLMPNDIVDVPVSGTKSVLLGLVGAIGPAAAQLPVHVIP